MRAFSDGAGLLAFFGGTLRLFFWGALPTCSGLGVMGDYGGDNENDDGCGDCVEYNNAKKSGQRRCVGGERQLRRYRNKY